MFHKHFEKVGNKRVNIIFDDHHGEYTAGKTIHGRVEFVLNSLLQLKAIYIEFKGNSRIQWYRGKERTEIVRYTARESYIYKKVYLENCDISSGIVLQPGKVTYPFSFTLPKGIPDSFEGQHGNIRYLVKVTVQKQWHLDIVEREYFTVTTPIDLKNYQEFLAPSVNDIKRSFGFWCCKSEPLCFKLILPARAFVPGEEIVISIEFKNSSTISVDEIKFVLQEVILYKSPGDTRKEVTIIRESTLGNINTRESTKWNQVLHIPSCHAVRNLSGCKIIDIYHEILFNAMTPTCHRNIIQKIPIMLGHIYTASDNKIV